MTGGGFGGSVVVLLEDAALDAVTLAVTGAFAERGFFPPKVISVVASDGASRLACNEPPGSSNELTISLANSTCCC